MTPSPEAHDVAATTADTVRQLLAEHGQTYAEEAGIRLRDTPAPLYQLLVLAHLLSARISADIAVAAARELFAAGYTTARHMLEASWQDRVDALGRGHYRRYDERTATQLGDGARLVLDRWHGDLRALHHEACDDGDDDASGDRSDDRDDDGSGDRTGDVVDRLKRLLTEYPGIGPSGADIFLREVQAVWSDIRPYVDARALAAAGAAHLPDDPERLAATVEPDRIVHLAAALVRSGVH